MEIPTSVEEQQGVRVMFGNPFDNTITIEEDGKIVKMKVGNRCRKCGSKHMGKCTKKVAMLETGRWFFVGKDEMECKMCKGKFGGGSTTRPGGSGMRAHLGRSKKYCGMKWEEEFYKKFIRKIDIWDGEYKLGVLVRWMTLRWEDRNVCKGCGKGMLKKSVREHVRKYDKCEEGLR